MTRAARFAAFALLGLALGAIAAYTPGCVAELLAEPTPEPLPAYVLTVEEITP